ncbi:MAG: hypothetical protein HY586_07240 [Candidatus Omnitrophica bacterium]|nr:hypothetical protein [Candidatus Omnitrophota bacterium]
MTPRIIFLDSRHRLWRSLDEGGHWTRVFELSGKTEAEIHRSYVSPHHPSTLYLLSTEGLFISQDLGNEFKLLFSPPNAKERNCTCLTFHPTDPDILLLGTQGGLFWTLDGGETWQRELFTLGAKTILKILLPESSRDNEFLILTSSSIYAVSRNGKNLKQLYSSGLPAEAEAEETPQAQQMLFDICRFESSLLLASVTGMLESKDGGANWRAFPMFGLGSKKIYRIAAAGRNQRLFAATDSGVYQYEARENRWHPLKNGMDGVRIHDLSFHGGEEEKLYAVNSSGVYSLALSPIEIRAGWLEEVPGVSPEAARFYFLREPDIRGVHEAVMGYSGVHPQKIDRWQRESRLRNFLPRVSAGLSRSRAQNVDIDRGGTNNPDVFIAGPEESSWDEQINVTWSLADLIWSPDQTAIDSRSKLMTELRSELLSNVTRIYFERQRKIMELMLEPPEDIRSQIQRAQEIRELTAHLDAYTGGYFTRELEKRNLQEPWELAVIPAEALPTGRQAGIQD